jgi:hypothetical protein
MDPVYQITDIVPGLWIWRFPHPDWSPPDDGDRRVTSTCVATGGEVIVLDPLAPPADAAEIWARLDTQPPTSAMVIKPDHVRSICAFVERYRCHAYGPEVFQLDDCRPARSSRCGTGTSCLAASSRSMTAEAATRCRSGSPSTAQSSSPTPSPPSGASSRCGHALA